MKKALVHKDNPSRICDLVEDGKEFEVMPEFEWVSVPDDTSQHDTLNEDGSITKFDPTEALGFKENAYKIARQMAYSDIGTQLDMIFKELSETGTLSSDGPWASMIRAVKANIPKDDHKAVYEWNTRYVGLLQAGYEKEAAANMLLTGTIPPSNIAEDLATRAAEKGTK